MEQQLEQIREQQKQTWDTFAPGWKKWDDFVMNMIRPAGDEIIRQLNLKETDVVLDVATGTGEPGLSIAAIVKKGKVTGIDLSPVMLAVARENALKKDITNYETVESDVTKMPFADATFDAISCRFGFMFFPDMLMAAKEMVRVLKPGGRIAITVWGPPANNFWVTSIMGPIMKNMQLPQPPAGSPGIFRCANPDEMINLFKKAGFKNISQKEINGKAEMESFDFYWTYMNDVAGPIVEAMSKADDAMRIKIKQEIADGIKQKYPAEGALKMDYQALLFYGEK